MELGLVKKELVGLSTRQKHLINLLRLTDKLALLDQQIAPLETAADTIESQLQSIRSLCIETEKKIKETQALITGTRPAL